MALGPSLLILVQKSFEGALHCRWRGHEWAQVDSTMWSVNVSFVSILFFLFASLPFLHLLLSGEPDGGYWALTSATKSFSRQAAEDPTRRRRGAASGRCGPVRNGDGQRSHKLLFKTPLGCLACSLYIGMRFRWGILMHAAIPESLQRLRLALTVLTEKTHQDGWSLSPPSTHASNARPVHKIQTCARSRDFSRLLWLFSFRAIGRIYAKRNHVAGKTYTNLFSINTSHSHVSYPFIYSFSSLLFLYFWFQSIFRLFSLLLSFLWFLLFPILLLLFFSFTLLYGFLLFLFYFSSFIFSFFFSFSFSSSSSSLFFTSLVSVMTIYSRDGLSNGSFTKMILPLYLHLILRSMVNYMMLQTHTFIGRPLRSIYAIFCSGRQIKELYRV